VEKGATNADEIEARPSAMRELKLGIGFHDCLMTSSPPSY
jgi:hypothetical protein